MASVFFRISFLLT